MGFDPLRDIKYIRLAHEAGLGCGDPREIEIVGDQAAAAENWHFAGPFKKMTFATQMQHKIYWGPLKKPVEWSLKTWLAPWSYIASVIYHDLLLVPRATAAARWQDLLERLGPAVPELDEAVERSDQQGFPWVGEEQPEFKRNLSRC